MLPPDYPCLYLVIMDEAARREGAKFEGRVATLRSDPRKVWHYVEFTIDEYGKIFIRSPRESISQRGLHDATDVVQLEIYSLYAILPRSLREWHRARQRERRRAAYPDSRSYVVVSESPGFGDDLPLRMTLDRITYFAGLIIGLSPIAINGGLSHFNAGHSTIAQRVWTMTWLAFGCYIGIITDLTANGLLAFNFGAITRILGSLNELLVSAIYSAPAIGGFVVVAQMLMSYGRCVEIDGVNL